MTASTSENNTGIKNHVLVFIIYALLIAAFYSPVFFSGKSLVPSLYQPHGVTSRGVYGEKGRTPLNTFNVDMATPVYYEAPVNKLVGDMYREGKVPLWNPYQGGGTPLAAQYSTRVFFPYQIAEDLSPEWTWDYFLLGRLLIAGFFTYLFISSLCGGTSFSAFAGGLFYMFSGVFTWFISLEQLTNTAMTLPVLLLSVELLARGAPGARWVRVKIVFAAIAVALTLLAGQPETALYCLALAALYYIFRTVTTKGIAGGIKTVPRIIIAFITGLAMSAPLIILFVELVRGGSYIGRAGGAADTERLLDWHALFNVLTPTLSYFPLNPHTIKGSSHLAKAAGSYFTFLPINGLWDNLGGYTGVLPLFLILSGIFISPLRKKLPQRANFFFFIFVAAFLLLKNTGIWPFILLDKAPVFDMLWNLRWAGPLWVFSIAVAAALGLQLIEVYLTSSGDDEGAREKKTFFLPTGVPFILAAGIIAVLYVIYSFLPSLSIFFHRGDVFNDAMRPFVFPSIISGSLVTLITLGAAFSLTYFFKDEKKNIYALLILAVVELWWSVPRGYAVETLTMKWVPLGVGLLAVSFLFRNKIIFTLLALIVFFGSAFFMDTIAPNGLPPRDEPFRSAPYVSAILKDSAGGRPRVAGAYGSLFPNYASAIRLDDVRYANSVTSEQMQSFREKYLQSQTSDEVKEMGLWFSGRPESVVDVNLKSAPEEDFIERERGYSMLGVGYLIFPANWSYGLDETGKSNLFEEKFPLLYAAGDAKVFKNPNALPRVYLAASAIKADSWEEAQKIFMEGDFNPAHTIVVEEDVHLSSPAVVRGEDLKAAEPAVSELRAEDNAGNKVLEVKPPEVKGDKVKALKEKASVVKGKEVKTGEEKAAEVKEVTLPVDKVEGANLPVLKADKVKTSELKSPVLTTQEAAPENPTVPEGLSHDAKGQTPEVRAGAAAEIKASTAEPANPEIKAPDVKAPEVKSDEVKTPPVIVDEKRASKTKVSVDEGAEVTSAGEQKASDVTKEAAVEPAAVPTLAPLKNGARISEYSENRVAVDVKSERDTVLVLGDIFYPGWRVRVNGEKGRIIRVNGLLRGVPLKAGSSSVVFTYFPLNFMIGLLLLVISGIFCIFLIYKEVKGD